MDEINPVNNTVLLNVFLIFKKRYRVCLHYNLVVWEKENSSTGKTQIPVCDIISIVPITHRKNDCLKGFTINYGKRGDNRKTINKWKLVTVHLFNNDIKIIQTWIHEFQGLLNEQKYRPKNLLLFINPYGGKKNGMKIYEKYGNSLFKLAGIDCNVIVSQRRYQIRDFILTQSLEQCDGIICIGGDGTFSEVFNGLIYRTMKDLDLDPQNPSFIPKPKIPIGIIPGGSTDTIAYCLHGTIDIQTSIIHIILGQKNGLDLSSVSNENGLMRFYASVLSYGYLGDVLLDSEKFRWMGPQRYNYSGFKKFIKNFGYDSEVQILMEDEILEKKIDEKKIKCLENCQRCENFNLDNDDVIDEKSEKWKIIRGVFFMINGANISCSCPRSPNGFSPYCHLGDGFIDLVLVRHTTFFNNLRFLLKMSGKNGEISDLPFVEIYRTRKFYFRTFSFGGGGGQQSSTTSLSGASNQPLNLSQSNYFQSSWNCDGEILHELDVTVRSHIQLISVFKRGLTELPDEKSCCFK